MFLLVIAFVVVPVNRTLFEYVLSISVVALLCLNLLLALRFVYEVVLLIVFNPVCREHVANHLL